VAPDLAAASKVPHGTPAGPFRTLFVQDDEAAFEARKATVHAVLVVALVRCAAGQRLLWGTSVESVGAITRFYMALIDPFRRFVVYSGLEGWLRRVVRETRPTAPPP